MQKEHEYGGAQLCEFIELSRSQKEHLIDEWICNERDRYILKRRLLDGITFERLAEELDRDGRFIGLTVRQIQNIARKGKQTLIKHIKIS